MLTKEIKSMHKSSQIILLLYSLISKADSRHVRCWYMKAVAGAFPGGCFDFQMFWLSLLSNRRIL